jgi:uncharacterized NAD(P)/FAD-binding protein YdhS
VVRELEELGGIAAARAALDRHERDLIDRARRAGATWAQVAEALGLASRQAAEQRRQRLAAATRRAAAGDDRRYGDRIVALRATVAVLHARIAADSGWDTRFVRAELVRGTVAAAVEAEPGALFALARAAAADLAEAPAVKPPAPLRSAVNDLLHAVRLSTLH